MDNIQLIILHMGEQLSFKAEISERQLDDLVKFLGDRDVQVTIDPWGKRLLRGLRRGTPTPSPDLQQSAQETPSLRLVLPEGLRQPRSEAPKAPRHRL